MARTGRPPTVDWYERKRVQREESLTTLFRQQEARILYKLWVRDYGHGDHVDRETVEVRRRVARQGPALNRLDRVMRLVYCEQRKSWPEQIL